uniref:Uncharacterized protein n=1 Tax=Trypanosoma brucei TaxID=5691 RepID=Q582Z2_9TRYP|nr:hypothetical protein, unlikely [Trypanosoma brucei]
MRIRYWAQSATPHATHEERNEWKIKANNKGKREEVKRKR